MGKKNVALDRVIHTARQKYALSLKGIHGPSHWQRVRENGLRLAKETGANVNLVERFAFLHDCCREDDGWDPEHGPRAAEFILTLRDDVLSDLSQHDIEILYEAIHDHTTGKHHKDPTIATCWDSDRLDIGRVGMKPQERFLTTKAARDQKIIEWAYKKSRKARR